MPTEHEKTNQASRIPSSDPSVVEIQPHSHLEFVCTKFQISAAMKISINQFADPQSRFSFRIRGTNKQDYNVTEPQGKLRVGQHKVVFFYLKQSAPVSRNINDQFMVIVDEHRSDGTVESIFQKKYPITIQSGLEVKNANMMPFQDPKHNNRPHNSFNKIMAEIIQSNLKKPSPAKEKQNLDSPKIRPAGSTFTPILSPLLLKPLGVPDEVAQYRQSAHNKSDLNKSGHNKSKFSLNNSSQPSKINNNSLSLGSNSRLYSTLVYDVQLLQQYKEQAVRIRHEFETGVQNIDRLKRKRLDVEVEVKAAEARSRFRVYVVLVMIVLGFLAGMLAKKMDVHGRVIELCYGVKHKIEIGQDDPIDQKAHDHELRDSIGKMSVAL